MPIISTKYECYGSQVIKENIIKIQSTTSKNTLTKKIMCKKKYIHK